jgi:LRR receptor-like serine/threonine-protein kinase FLS2
MLTGNILMFNNSSLQHLHLGHNNMTGILPSNVCQGLPKLRSLNLVGNDFSGAMPNVWCDCKELEDLELSVNNFDKGRMPADIGKLTKLKFLYLTDNNLEGKIYLQI